MIRILVVGFRRAGQTFEKERLDPSKDTQAGLFELDRYDPRALE